MAKKAQRKRASKKKPRKRAAATSSREASDVSKPKRKPRDENLENEIEARVLDLFLDGKNATSIFSHINQLLRLESPLSREDVYKYLVRAASHGRLRYQPLEEQELADQVVRRQKWLEGKIHIVPSLLQVATQGARQLCAMIRDHRRLKGLDEIRVGFAGGRTPSLMCRELAFMLQNPTTLPGAPDDYPETIVFQSLIGNLNNPPDAPDGYFLYFTQLPNEQPADEANGTVPQGRTKTRFTSFPAPGVVLQEKFDSLSQFEMISQAKRQVDSLDIVVTSGGHWGPGHGAFYDYIQLACGQSTKLKDAWNITIKHLEKQKIIGDVLWCPVNQSGDIDEAHIPRDGIRVTHLMDLAKAAEFARPGSRKDILLVVGPCSGKSCEGTPGAKGLLFKSIIEMDKHIVSQIVVDTHTVRQYLSL